MGVNIKDGGAFFEGVGVNGIPRITLAFYNPAGKIGTFARSISFGLVLNSEGYAYPEHLKEPSDD